MRKNTGITSIVFILAASFIFYSCQKSIQEPTGSNGIAAKANASNLDNPEIVPYQFEFFFAGVERATG